ncbi:hypothetical protein CQY20_33850 [Mycolicibacterium agri]|uniref:Uncharacterized protein n=1 Tax=Mycolicibacterium agri TaxID=36811 RepID=A0A2A7MMZ7_MYCAG|nr:hypothetical protein CQY20_33850 [Mycolicibacterium agri]GFG50592.1 hypothetical protein MAGR_20330 [Mycolicibacterium agri]
MLEFTDLQASPSHTAQPDQFLALDTGAESCFGLIKGRGDRLSLIGKGDPEISRLGRVSRPALCWQTHLNCLAVTG